MPETRDQAYRRGLSEGRYLGKADARKSLNEYKATVIDGLINGDAATDTNRLTAALIVSLTLDGVLRKLDG